MKMATREYQQCTRCVMDTSDVDITFDHKGFCNHCKDYFARIAQRVYLGEESDRQLANIITNITDTSTIEVNSYVEGINIPVSKVLSKTANSITIQNNCTATNTNVNFTIYKVDFTYDTPNKYYDFETLIISEPGLLPDGVDLTITLPPLLAFGTQNFGDLQINHNPNIAYQTSNKTIVKVLISIRVRHIVFRI
jgi:hypothetical protein